MICAVVARAVRPFPEFEKATLREIDEVLDGVDGNVADRLRSFHQQALFGAVEHIVFISPVFWLSVIPIVFLGLICLAWVRGSRLVDRFPADLVDSEAARLGSLA